MEPSEKGGYVMSELYQNLSHSRWDCKYHVVFVPNGLATLCFTSLNL